MQDHSLGSANAVLAVFAAVAAVTLSQVAILMTIFAALVSATCGIVKLRDRYKRGDWE